MRGSAALLTDQSAAQEAFEIFDTLSANVARFVTILLQVKVFKKKCEKVCVFYMKFCNPLLTIFRKTLLRMVAKLNSLKFSTRTIQYT